MCRKRIIHFRILDPQMYEKYPPCYYNIKGVAGLYLYLYAQEDKVCIFPNHSKLLSTGIEFHNWNFIFTEKIRYFILPRAGLGYSKNIIFGNFINFTNELNGLELKLFAWNRSKLNFYIYSGEIIAQFIFISDINIQFDFVFD